MNEKINLTGPADLLATIPHLLGITPSESFVVLTAHAGALGATLRVDAPEHVEPGNYAQTLTSHAANDDKATASYVVVYTDENQDSYPYAAEKELFARLADVGREMENRVTGNDSSRLKDQGLKTESTSAAGYGSAEHHEKFAESLSSTGANETQIRGRRAAARSEGTHPSAAVTMGKGAAKARKSGRGASVGAERGKGGPSR